MSPYLKIPLTILVALAILTLAVTAVFVGGYYYLAPSVPSAEDLRNIRIQVPLQIYSRDGRLIEEFGEEKRTPVAYENIPEIVVKAVLAAEDEHFFEHSGIDWRGIARGFLSEIGAGGRGGGSTITQQVTRTSNLFPRAGTRSGFERFVQKYREWILAFRIEHGFTKQEILALYLNTYYYGQRSYGIVTAARTYFGKELRDLSISEVAILAGITARPEDYNPIASPERATARRAYVLRRMRETEAIDDAQYKTALAEPVVVTKYVNQNRLDAPYLAEMVRLKMIQMFGPAAQTAGLKVTTTVDSRLQRAANRAIRDTLTAYDERHGYRGPLARVDLGDASAAAGTGAPLDTVKLEALLDDHAAPLPDFDSAIVLAVEAQSAHVYFKGSGEETIPFDAVTWAAPYIDDDRQGARPTTMPQVLHIGDIVLFRRDAAGNRRLAELPEVQGAFASVDPQDGAIVALTGGYNYVLSKYNRATQTNRQPGSSFKPFIYSAALANGFTTASIVNDAPVDLGYQPELERVWKPANFNNEYFGEVTLRFALRKSLNSVSIKLTQDIGVPDVVRYAKRFGFDDDAAPNNLSIALGSGAVSPLELARAYSTFANGGFRVQAYFIDRITDANGTELYRAQPSFVCADCEAQGSVAPGTEAPPPVTADGRAALPSLIDSVTELYPPLRVAPRIITAQNAFLMTDLLKEVVTNGSGAPARREIPRNDMAGKTGTTNDGKDTWFVGFNSDVVGAAWVGFDQGERPLGPSEQGGFTAIPMWIGYMKEALSGLPAHTMARPPGIIEYRINPKTGQIASDATRDSVFEKFEIGHIPEREPDPEFRVTGPAGPASIPAGTAKDPLFE
ncbi:MAG TPA: PBP1A family penicillin-binding protein [Gammaproteobacteria bacterium]|nr:PBP1A family penicillin-binding protein [Gammaproteobacteria bacterium]